MSFSTVLNQIFVNNSQNDKADAQVSLKNYLILLLGLTVCYALIYFYQIEEGFRLPYLFLLVIPSFAIHAKLPLSYRQPFLFLVNLIAILLLFGVWPGVGIIGFALLLFVVVSLPIRVLFRVLLSLMLGSVLVLGKIEYIPIPAFSTIATVVGGMFMFRAIVFLYEKQYEKQSAGLWAELNYFFLLPNLIFLFFPVVDYKTFVRSYYDVPAKTNYYKGLLWIMRGLFHLMVYRIVYYYFLPSPLELDSFFGVLQYLTLSYVLIIRLSGIFHLSTGILALFGLNLPPTFDNYFLATGFSDLWRRINVYWKDFIMKIFYFPIFFKFKKRNNKAIFITVIIVFIINWLLHQYQWFWVRGNFPIRWIDVIFWLLLGVLVALNSIYQKNNKKKKTIGFSKVNALKESLKIIGMFLFMSVLWSFWTSPNFDVWKQLMISGGFPNTTEWIQLILGVGVIAILGVGLKYIQYWLRKNKKQLNDDAMLKIFSVGSLIFVLLGSPQVSKEVGHLLAFDVEPILEMKLNKADEEQLFKGYYESLLVGNNFSSRMWEVEEDNKKEELKLEETLYGNGLIIRTREGLFRKRFAPDKQMEFKNKKFSTNGLGLRDRPYSLEKEPGVLRIALLGGSIELGSGVNDDEVFENIVEDFINERQLWPEFTRVEILNFSMISIHLPEQVEIVEQRILPFDPDVVLYCIHSVENNRNRNGFTRAFFNNNFENYPYLIEIAEKAQITRDVSKDEVARLLKPYSKKLNEWGLDKIASFCKENDIIPVCANIPAILEKEKRKKDELSQYQSRGFYLLNISRAFDGIEEEELKIGKWDRHPNAKGHQIIAEELMKALEENVNLNEAIRKKAEKN